MMICAADAALTRAVLPAAQFGDRFSITVSGRALDAETATALVMGRTPRWVGWLMRWRNRLVRPFGLKTQLSGPAADRIGVFPVISRSSRRMVLGLDDRHLDFRVVVEVESVGEDRQQVSATTLVETHNRMGRLYLAAVKPFHRIVVPAMLAQGARRPA